MIDIKKPCKPILSEADRIKAQRIPVSRFLVVWSFRHNEYQYMETVWTDEEIQDVRIWDILSEHSTKEKAREFCEILKSLQ